MTNVIEVRIEYANRYESIISTLLFKHYKNALNYINEEIAKYKKEEDYLETVLPSTDVWKMRFEDCIIKYNINTKTFEDND